jgi:hypothetical protein
LQNDADLEEQIIGRRARLRDLDFRDQPFVAVIEGDVPGILDKIIVVIDGTRYPMRSLLQAFDTLLKVFFVFNVEYPVECSNVWQFVQLYFYQIPLPKKNGAATRFIKLLQK